MSGRKEPLQLRVLQALRERRGVRVYPAAVRGGDDDRPAGIDDVANQLGAVRRRRAGRSDVLQDVDAGLERMPHVLLGVDVRVDLQPMPVRDVDDRLVVLAASGRRAP